MGMTVDSGGEPTPAVWPLGIIPHSMPPGSVKKAFKTDLLLYRYILQEQVCAGMITLVHCYCLGCS